MKLRRCSVSDNEIIILFCDVEQPTDERPCGACRPIWANDQLVCVL
jgi:hypothetical protein